MVILERLATSSHPQVIRVRATAREPDFDVPWAVTERERIGVAVAVAPHRVVTLASTVAWAVDPARIVAIDHDRDLALLSTDEDLPVAELDDLPAIGAVVLLVGATVGHGVTKELGLTRYAHSQRHLICFTVDPRQPLEAGGAAVMRSGKLTGLVMQPDDEQRVEVIPAAMIRAFLDGVAKPPGVPALGIGFQPLTNPALTARFGTGGILVTSVDRDGTCDGALAPRDVLHSIDGVPVDADGLVPYFGQALRHYVLLGTKHAGDRMLLGLRRDGALREVEVTLAPWQPLVPHAPRDRAPRYLVFGGLVFQPLTRDYLTTWETWWNNAPKELLTAFYLGRRTAERHELIVLTEVLESPLTTGYDTFVNETVVRVNDHVPRDLADLARILDAAIGTVTFETSSGALLACDVAAVRAATPALHAEHEIPADRNGDAVHLRR